MAPPPPSRDAQDLAAAPNPFSQAAEAIAAAEADQQTHNGALPQEPPASSRPSQAATQPSTRPIYEDDAPPPYSDSLGRISGAGQGLGTYASVGDDGRVNIRIDQKNKRLSNLLVPALRSQLEVASREPPPPPPYIPPSLGGEPGKEPPPPLNVVIHVVGSRGDVQPFVALGKVLKDTYGHRVRLATHPTFKKFVEENGLEFFSIGGDPAELMAFMVKNPGLMPGFDTLRNGDVGKRRKGIAELIDGCWRSCIESGDGFGVDVSEQRTESWVNSAANDPIGAATTGRPFVADAIIANPPSFAHIHCAEKLGIPLHMMFTMPWSPTQSFQHPLANIQSSNADASITNYLSYALVDMLTWQGLGDIINKFRQRTLNLEPLGPLAAPGMLARLRVPYTYCWSPALIPKPKDWGNQISISGFYFLSLASNFTPEPDLAAFLAAGPPPVYIGFGSIVVDDPNGMTKLIFDAVKKAGVRALVSKGWGGFGADQLGGVPEGVFMLGNVPHDWLFQHVACVVHHGGAGTTAAGISCGKPTVIVPFFGDQPFWGSMVARAGAGPEPIPHKQLTSENLAEAIQHALRPESLERAKELAAKISKERGCDVGAQCFHQHLKVDELRCSLLPSRAAVWRVKRTHIRLSALAAVVLANEGLVAFSDLTLYQPREYDPDAGPWDPVTGVVGAIMGTVTNMMMGVADLPIDALRALHIHPDASKSKSRTKSNPPPATGSASEADSVSSRNIGDQKGLTTPGSSSPGVSSPVHSDAARGSVTESSSEPHDRASDYSQSRATDASNAMTVEGALQSGKSVSRIVEAGFKAPMDVMLGLSRGFHNTSKLYGEEPRQVEKVTGLQSGLKVAGKEFGQGLFEGISGLVTQPLKGAKEEGAGGFLKGFGRGLAGITLKPQAAAFAIPAYTMKGIYMELRKPFGSTIQNYIIAARTAQGWEDYNKSTPEERAQIVGTYRYVSERIKKKKNPGEREMEAINQLLEKRRQKDTPGISGHRSNTEGLKDTAQQPTPGPPSRSTWAYTPAFTQPHQASPNPHGSSYHDPITMDDQDDVDLDEAIRQSIAETSRGNPEEDALISRAMRASIAELERRPKTHEELGHDEEEDAIRRALEASLADAKAKHPQESGVAHGDDAQARELEEVLRRSVLDTKAAHGDTTDRERDTSFPSPPTVGEVESDEDEELKRAMEESERERTRRDEEDRKAMTEEEIVLEYVKKQSLAEEEHRRRIAQGRE